MENKLRHIISENLKLISETKLSRIWRFIEEDKYGFGVISAFRGEYSKEDNIQRHIELKSILKEKGYGFIELKGGFKEEGGFVEELSLFIPNIPKNTLITLGTEYDQYSVIYKDSNEFVEIGTNQNSGIGNILRKFKLKSFDKNMIMDKDSVEDFFSSLMKGTHRGRKFLFNIDEGFLEEKVNLSFNEIAYGKKKVNNDEKWLKIF